MKKDGSKTFQSILTSLAYDYITSMKFGYLNVFNLICAMVALYKLWVINLVWGAITLLPRYVFHRVFLWNSRKMYSHTTINLNYVFFNTSIRLVFGCPLVTDRQDGNGLDFRFCLEIGNRIISYIS